MVARIQLEVGEAEILVVVVVDHHHSVQEDVRRMDQIRMGGPSVPVGDQA